MQHGRFSTRLDYLPPGRWTVHFRTANPRGIWCKSAMPKAPSGGGMGRESGHGRRLVEAEELLAVLL